MKHFDLISLFPQTVHWFAELGVTGDAVRRGLISMTAWNPRDECASGRPDDRGYGGGPGMVMQAEPVARALRKAQGASGARRPVAYLSPQGRRWDQGLAQELVQHPGLIFICGRYEGLDQRLVDTEVDLELSLGDFVLSGGELAALAMIDTMLRLLPGVLGDAQSAQDESFVDGKLECPQYTRPSTWRNLRVPPVLLSGDHAKIKRWRHKQALGQTWLKRPDLLADLNLADESLALLREFIAEQDSGSSNDV